MATQHVRVEARAVDRVTDGILVGLGTAEAGGDVVFLSTSRRMRSIERRLAGGEHPIVRLPVWAVEPLAAAALPPVAGA